MNILMVNEKGWFFGGVEQLVNDVSTGLAERGHRLALLSTEPCPAGRDPLHASFASSLCLDPALSHESWARQVRGFVDQIEPEVVYVHRFGPASAVEVLQGAAPVVRYVHDHDLYCPRRHKYFPLTTRICQRPMGVSCVTHGCLVTPRGPVAGLPWLIDLRAKRRELVAARRLERLAVGSPWMREALIANGFACEQVHVLPPVPRGLETEPQALAEEPLLLFVGQVIRGKGVDLLLRALTVVRQPCRAVVIGTGNHLDTCVGLTRRLGLGARVTFLGWVPHDCLPAYYRRARVVVVPSRWPEPFGMVGLEAMWASRPVVAFAVGGIPSWLEDGVTGFAVAEQDWKAFGQALDRLLAEPSLAAAMGRAAHQRVGERFAFGTQLDATEALLASAVGGGPAAVAGEGGDDAGATV